MSGVLTIKRGDTLRLTGSFKQPNGSAMSLVGFQVVVSIIDETNKVVTIVEAASGNRVLVVDHSAGTFSVSMKDTEVLKSENYWVDFKYVDASGIEQSSKSIKLKVKDKLV